MALFEYFPNYVWNLSLSIAMQSGAQLGETAGNAPRASKYRHAVPSQGRQGHEGRRKRRRGRRRPRAQRVVRARAAPLRPTACSWVSALPSSTDTIMAPKVFRVAVRRLLPLRASLSCLLSCLHANHGCSLRPRRVLQQVRGLDLEAQPAQLSVQSS